MSSTLITSDLVFLDNEFQENIVLEINETGTILDILSSGQCTKPPKAFSGILSPGFVNTHCHLELSHLYQQIPIGTGLPEFARQIILKRNNYTEKEILEAASRAETQMYNNGIQAVGDISNSLGLEELRNNSKMNFHVFLELIGYDPIKANEVFSKGINQKRELQARGNKVSLAAHAPYSVSMDLKNNIFDLEALESGLSSLHFAESPEEYMFLKSRKGGFKELFTFLGLNPDLGYEREENPVQWLGVPPSDLRLLLVHGTELNASELTQLSRSKSDLFFCLCPNANLYIEEKLPDIDKFVEKGIKLTFGTDSLASNRQLCILDEIKLINKKFPSIPLETLWGWATINGAEFLGMESLGFFGKGNAPGVICIKGVEPTSNSIFPQTEITRLY